MFRDIFVMPKELPDEFKPEINACYKQNSRKNIDVTESYSKRN